MLKHIKLIRDILHEYYGYDSQTIAIWSEELEPLIGMVIDQFLKKTYQVQFHIIPHRERYFKIPGDETSFDSKKYEAAIANLVLRATSYVSERSVLVIPSIGLANNELEKHVARMHKKNHLVTYPINTLPIANSKNYFLIFNLGGTESRILIDPDIYGEVPIQAIANRTLSIATLASEFNRVKDNYIENILIVALGITLVVSYLLKKLLQRYVTTSQKIDAQPRIQRARLAAADIVRRHLENKKMPRVDSKTDEQSKAKNIKSPVYSVSSEDEYIPPLFLSTVPSGRIITKKSEQEKAATFDEREEVENEEAPVVKPTYTELQQRNRDKLLNILRNDSAIKETLQDFLSGNIAAEIVRMTCDELEKFLLNKLEFTKPDQRGHKHNNHNFINLPDGTRGSLTPRKDSNLHPSRAPAKPDFIAALRNSLLSIEVTAEYLVTLQPESTKLSNRMY